ncbi:MAG: hypothetical protein HC884_05965 [Chloroflexaceae bacterium]|nr:hypothetical protein [Chloroflexaceae bacterium]
MEAIGSRSKPPNHVAFIFADGDSVGSAIQAVVEKYGFNGYSRFSQALSEAANQATAHTLAHVYQNHELREHIDQDTGKSYLATPFDIITIGGDDVLLISTADHALDIACGLSQEFQKRANTLLQSQGMALEKPLTLSVGVVIAHTGHPIVNLAQRAGELLKSAKRGRTKSNQSNQVQGWIDFHIVSTPGLEPLTEIRGKDYARPGQLSLTARPYALSKMQELLNQARSLRRELPGSKRSQLYHACFTAPDRVSATLAVLQAQVRMSHPQRTALFKALHSLGAGVCYPFVQSRTNRYTTSLPDLMELAAFIEVKQEAHP